MENINITSAQYVNKTIGTEIINPNDHIRATINDKEWAVPIAQGNKHYDEIMRQVDEGSLTIAEAE